MMKANWTDSQVRFIDRTVKAHDRDLFAERSHVGYIRVMRKACKFEQYDMGNGDVLSVQKDSPQLVFCLTDTWTANGKPIDWGALVVLDRLKKHDVWNNEALFAELEREEEEEERRQERNIMNSTEAFLSESHKDFKETFKDVRTCNFDKTDRRRRKYEKRMNLKS